MNGLNNISIVQSSNLVKLIRWFEWTVYNLITYVIGSLWSTYRIIKDIGVLKTLLDLGDFYEDIFRVFVYSDLMGKKLKPMKVFQRKELFREDYINWQL